MGLDRMDRYPQVGVGIELKSKIMFQLVFNFIKSCFVKKYTHVIWILFSTTFMQSSFVEKYPWDLNSVSSGGTYAERNLLLRSNRCLEQAVEIREIKNISPEIQKTNHQEIQNK